MTKLICISAEGDSLSFGINNMFWRAVNGGAGITYAGNSGGPRYEFRRAYGSHIAANFSYSGRKLTDLISVASVDDSFVNLTPRGVNGRVIRDYILCVSVGTNNSDTNPVTFAASVGAYCTARKAAGWRIILCTIPSRTDGLVADHDNVFQQPYNAIIRAAGWAAANGVDLICDIATNVELGSVGASNNPTYAAWWSGDFVHPSPAGFILAAVTYKAAIDSLIATRMAGF